MLAACCLTAQAQRMMEDLNRGLVAVQTEKGVFTSWRIHGTEYYDTQYNLYRDGKLVNPEPLDVSNFTDPEGTASSTYTVKAVVRDEEQDACEPAEVWDKQYLTIPMGKMYSRRGTDITLDYFLNDATAADLDGDGEMEIIVKRLHNNDGLFYPENDSAFTFFEAYKLDGTRLWQIDIGPNMISAGEVETNITAFDWDEDGKAELLMRAMDGTIVYASDGTKQVIGDPTKNYRDSVLHTANMTYSMAGEEYLIYMEGATAKLYNPAMQFPLKRLENGETDLNAAWGDGYGHRANKFFFGAPYLDGRHPSIFLARGIYTRHKMIAYDVNPETHELVERWRWLNNEPGSPWFGEGYHNFGIADVDWDGRDEIVYGSMVIDDNGKGLSTTGYGHGDAQHCSDFDPYHKGQEIQACNENKAGANFRDATTSRVYHWYQHPQDCGRCMAGKFTEEFMGSQCTPGPGILSSVTHETLPNASGAVGSSFRTYWNGDLCSESLDGTNITYYDGTVIPLEGTHSNNGTKGTPSLQADIFGDWREEVINPSTDDQSLIIYTTTIPTRWRNYTLLHDMQYRQAICWQMCGYNQPPHVSYFMGETEGYTTTPPPLMTNGRTEVKDAITTAQNEQHVLLADPEGGEVTVAEDASPYILTVNAFSHTEGHDNNDNITTSYSTYTLKGGTFGGDMRLVKQGEGILNLSGEQTYSGPTDLWGGTVNFTGKLPNSRVWMNRFAELNAKADFGKDIKMEYASVLRVGGTGEAATIHADSVTMRYGAVMEFDLYSENTRADRIVLAKGLSLETLNRSDGPEFQAPIFRFTPHYQNGKNVMAAGRYLIAEVKKIDGNVDDILLQGLETQKCHLEYENGQIFLVIKETRDATQVYWDGTHTLNEWNLNENENFNNAGEADIFVSGDDVVFDDAATDTSVRINENLYPKTVTFDNDTKTYSLSGNGGISGETGLTKKGNGTLVITSTNTYTGKTTLEGGVTTVSALADSIVREGALGCYTKEIGRFEIKNGATLRNTVAIKNGVPITIGEGGAVFQTDGELTLNKPLYGNGNTLTKTGTSNLILFAADNLKKTYLKEGTLQAKGEGVLFGDTLIFIGNATYQDFDDGNTYSLNLNNLKVEEGVTGTMRCDSRCENRIKLFGKGTLKIYVPWIRSDFTGDWSAFEGTIEPSNPDNWFALNNSYGMPKGTLNIPERTTVSNTAKPYTLGKVTGKGTLTGDNNTWRIGSLNEDFSFQGKIEGTGTQLIKVGTGKMSLTNIHSFTGDCTVQEGTLLINNASATEGMLGTGSVTVKANGTFCGRGKLNNGAFTVEKDGLLYPGVSETATTGTIDFSENSVTIDKDGILLLNIASKTRCTNLTGVKILNLYGILRLHVRESLSLEAGDEFRLWEANRTRTRTTTTFELDRPGEGLEWDTTDIEDGIVRVKLSTSVDDIHADEEVTCEVFTVGGAQVGSFTCARKDIRRTLKQSGAAPGTYMVKTIQGSSTATEKISIDY